MHGRRQGLREDVCKLIRGRYRDELEMSILNGLMCEMLPDVNVLGTLASTDDVVTPFDARCVVLEHRSGCGRCESQPPEKVAKINHLDSRCRCGVVLGFGS